MTLLRSGRLANRIARGLQEQSFLGPGGLVEGGASGGGGLEEFLPSSDAREDRVGSTCEEGRESHRPEEGGEAGALLGGSAVDLGSGGSTVGLVGGEAGAGLSVEGASLLAGERHDVPPPTEPMIAIRMPFPDTLPEEAPRAQELPSEVPATTFSPLGLEISPVTSRPYRPACSAESRVLEKFPGKCGSDSECQFTVWSPISRGWTLPSI